MSKVLAFLMAALASASCMGGRHEKSEVELACDTASQLVAEQFEKLKNGQESSFLAKTGKPRIYFEAVAGGALSSETIASLKGAPSVYKNVLSALVLAGNDSKVAKLLSSGFDANERSEEGVPLVVIAAQCNRLPVMKRLVQFGADLSARDSQGMDAMMIAKVAHHEKILKYLQEQENNRKRKWENRGGSINSP